MVQEGVRAAGERPELVVSGQQARSLPCVQNKISNQVGLNQICCVLHIYMGNERKNVVVEVKKCGKELNEVVLLVS